MQTPTLLVLAAGMGSRYGGIKQIEGFGPNGETILEYSIYDAVRSGFERVVFVVRKDIKDAVNDIVAPALKGRAEFLYAIQDGNRFVPEKYRNPARTKPWGTGHAVLCAADDIDGPFAVINADDFYGPEAFQSMAGFLKADKDPNHHAMVGYELRNVLSEHGTVSRGVCKLDDEGFLVGVDERTKVQRQGDRIIYNDGEKNHYLDERDVVSMNFWGFKPGYFDITRRLFDEYLAINHDSTTAEFFIPIVAQHIIDSVNGRISVLRGGTTWFGVTYPEDKPAVQAAIDTLLDKGIYPKSLWT